MRASVQGVLREVLIAACLTGLMILLFLGNWRATLIIAVSIPLSMITSIIALSALGQTINIMTLGGLALAVGILVDDATVAIENINHQFEQGKTLEQAILDGAHQIAIPTLVSTLSICIVFVPMLLLTGVAHYLFIPLAEAVVFAMLASYFFSRTLVPTLAKYLLRYHHKPADLHLEARVARPGLFVTLFLACCCASLLLLPFIGRDFFPAVDAGTIALTNERNAVAIARRRMAASVALVKALGGGWDTSRLPGDDALVHPSTATSGPTRAPAPGSEAEAHG
ncbi:multidrug efflux pump subunit AcrB [Paraburkholderia sp. Cpub6]|nr:multidrug efflux pump subunit AcrB [Paraburkholderia sp. Cpub6]